MNRDAMGPFGLFTLQLARPSPKAVVINERADVCGPERRSQIRSATLRPRLGVRSRRLATLHCKVFLRISKPEDILL